jgi:subtilisin family serine protease
MRFPVLAAAAALALIFTFAVTGTAGAATCSFPASAYSTGAPWDVSNPGPQPVNDPVFPDQWGLTQIKAPAAWARGADGSGVTIAIVDTGVDQSHPDLQANLASNNADFNPPEDQGCPGAQDENGHGTHVAGIAAAVTNNGIGVAGTAPAAKIMAVRVLDAEGSGEDPAIIAGIRYAADNGAKVINMSLGGAPIIGETPALNQEIIDAVEYAYSKGTVVVAAAGNESLPLCSYPAAAKNAVCVGATDSRGLPTFYSNFPNSPDGNVGVRAPGGVGSIFCEDTEDVWSTMTPEGDPCTNPATKDLSGYDTLAGSSMASPFVAGVAAQLAGKGLSAPQILECLRTTSSNKGSYDPVMGYGIVDADAASSTCTTSMPGFNGASSGSGGQASNDFLAVTVKRTTPRRLARTRTLRVKIRSSKAVKVKLRAVMRKSRKGKLRTLKTKRVKLAKAGTKRTKLKLSKRKARQLRRAKRASIQLRYSGGGHKGVASATK